MGIIRKEYVENVYGSPLFEVKIGGVFMLLEPTGKELFIELCKRLNQLKLVIDAKKKRVKWEESVAFIFHEEIQEIAGKKINQVATVQYLGGEKRMLNNDLTGVVLRLYLVPFKTFGLENILMTSAIQFNAQQKGPSNSLYYDFIFEEPYSTGEVYNAINSIFKDIYEGFSNAFHSVQKILPIETFPESIKSLPKRVAN